MAIYNINFNQDHGMFACAMESGVRVYNIEPLKELMHLDSSAVGSLKLCEMCYRDNILAMVGGGNRQKLADNCVLVFDVSRQGFIAEIQCDTAVLAVKLRRNRMYIAERTVIQVLQFPMPNSPMPIEKLRSFDTGNNPRGLFEASPFPSSERQILVYPGHYKGSIQIIDLSLLKPDQSAAPITINAHESEIVYIAINLQGTMVATASERGTLIRVFDTFRKTRLIELRRGSDSAMLYCINFSSDSDFLCASSDKGTVHIFSLKDTVKNKKSVLSNAAKLMGSMAPYPVNSEWSFAKFQVPQEVKGIVAFGSNSSINAVNVDGTFQKYIFTESGRCYQDIYNVFLQLVPDDDFQF